MFGEKSGFKYYSFYFLMDCDNFFSTNVLNVELVSGLVFLF